MTCKITQNHLMVFIVCPSLPRSMTTCNLKVEKASDDEEETGMWEESFKGFSDSKPNGMTNMVT